MNKYEKYSLTLFILVMAGFLTACYFISKKHETKPVKRVIVYPETYLDERL